jgi:hypothetical protein
MKRGRNQRRRQGGGGMNMNRALDSNGPEVRIRGTANQIYEKYLALARDASSSGDRVKAENYLQHAEHYFRVIRAMQPAPLPQTEQPADGDFEGEQPQLGGYEDRRPEAPAYPAEDFEPQGEPQPRHGNGADPDAHPGDRQGRPDLRSEPRGEFRDSRRDGDRPQRFEGEGEGGRHGRRRRRPHRPHRDGDQRTDERSGAEERMSEPADEPAT